MYQTYDTLKHRWARVKDFINYTQPTEFWADANIYLRKLTKSLIEDTLDEEMIQYMQTLPYLKGKINSIAKARDYSIVA
ncbi:MAG: hypothetical protein QMD94_05915, partial [Candidatus Omnitrophota bacterium]|nr:hypothetical protein [Candidatus Omnitrophota bacterium]